MTQISYSSIISHFQFWGRTPCPFVFTQHLRTTHPDEGAVGVLSGGASRHNGGCSGEPAVHRDKSNSKPMNSNEIQIKERKNKPDSRGAKEKGALAKGGGGKESWQIKRQYFQQSFHFLTSPTSLREGLGWQNKKCLKLLLTPLQWLQKFSTYVSYAQPSLSLCGCLRFWDSEPTYKHRQEHGCKSDGRVVSRRSFIGVDRWVFCNWTYLNIVPQFFVPLLMLYSRARMLRWFCWLVSRWSE